MIIYLNADSGGFSFNKKDYLLRAAKRMDWLMFQDVRDAIGPIDYLLNIQPCNLKRGGKWSGLWHIDVSLDSHFPDQYGELLRATMRKNEKSIGQNRRQSTRKLRSCSLPTRNTM